MTEKESSGSVSFSWLSYRQWAAVTIHRLPIWTRKTVRLLCVINWKHWNLCLKYFRHWTLWIGLSAISLGFLSKEATNKIINDPSHPPQCYQWKTWLVNYKKGKVSINISEFVLTIAVFFWVASQSAVTQTTSISPHFKEQFFGEVIWKIQTSIALQWLSTYEASLFLSIIIAAIHG